MAPKAGSFLRQRPRRALPLTVVVLLGAVLLLGWHWGKLGWRDMHYNYPR